MSTTVIIILVVVVLLVLWGVSIYNNLVRLRNNRENDFANIDVQLKQRHDLIPQLVATVKGYASHEKEVLMRVTEARSAAMGATSINDKIQAENALSSALSGLKISLEAYPDLKANQNFLRTWRTSLRQPAASSIRQRASSTMPCRHSRRTFSQACSASERSRCSKYRRKSVPLWTRHLR